MITNKTQLINGYWIIGANKWDKNIYTQNQAEKNADNLVNCINCVNCTDCSYCIGCTNCSYCVGCRNCRGCVGCTDCIRCIDCRDCSNCRVCNDCRDCRDCSSCSNFKTNPERITSPKIGSRTSHTTYYFTNKQEQIVCGCYKGTLSEFEIRVRKVHGDNKQGQDYMRWIEKVKLYIK